MLRRCAERTKAPPDVCAGCSWAIARVQRSDPLIEPPQQALERSRSEDSLELSAVVPDETHAFEHRVPHAPAAVRTQHHHEIDRSDVTVLRDHARLDHGVFNADGFTIVLEALA